MIGKSPYSWFIKPHLFISIILIIFALISGITFTVINNYHEDAVNNIINFNKSSANLIANIILENQKAAIEIIQSYCKNPLIIDAAKKRDSTKAIKYIRHLKEGHPDVEGVFVTDKRSILWANYPVHKETHGMDLSYHDWYKGLSEEWKPYISHVYERITAKKDLVVVICTPILDEKNKIIGIIGISKLTRSICNLINQVILYHDVKITLIDQMGQIVYSNRFPYEKENTRYPSFESVQEATKGEIRDVEVQDLSEGNKTKYIAYVPIKEIGWSVIVEKEKREIFESGFGRFFHIGFISILLFLLIALSLVYIRKEIIFRQMTELKRTEDELKERERRYSSILESISLIAVSLDINGNITYANPSLLKLAGYTQEEIMGRNWFDNFVPERLRGVVNNEVFHGLLLNNEIYNHYENPILTKAGDERLISWNNTLLKDISGNVVGTMSIGEDITENKRSEEALIIALEETRQRNAEILALLEGSRAVLEYHEFKDAAQAIFDSCKNLIGATAGYIALLSKDGAENESQFLDLGELSCAVNSDLSMSIRGLQAEAYQTGKVFYCNDFPKSKWALYLPEGHANINNVLFAPLIIKGKALGLLGLANKPGGFTENDICLASAFSELAAISLNNSKTIELLENSEERYRSVVQTATAAVISVNSHGRIASWNNGAEKIFGYQAGEIAGLPVTILIPERFRNIHENAFNLLLTDGESDIIGKTLEMIGVRKDKSEFPIEFSTARWKTKEGNFFTAIIHDISERKQSEEALRESEEKYRTLFEESKDVIYISTPEGKFIDINPAGVELFGYNSKEDLLNVDIARDINSNPEDRDKFKQLISRQGFVKDFEYKIKRKDGEKRTTILTATAVYDKKGNIVAHRSILRDITNQRKLEQQYRQSQKMEAVGQLAGGIAHDFNNILTAIIGYGDIMLMKMKEDDPLRSYINNILTSSRKAADLVHSILAFARRQMINPKPVDLNRIIKKVEKLLLRIIGEDIELKTVLIDKKLIVMADSAQIEQVLMNLATNARDAMPDGGQLIISTGLGEIDDEYIKTHGYGDRGVYALISVQDTGSGMDKKTKDKIFEPFFTTKELGKGTGLGLSMVYGIVKQHSGYINVYSEVGKGAIFKICLPIVESEELEEESIKQITPGTGTETILLAEDEAEVREITKSILEEYGYKVIEAVNGEDTIEKFMENKDKIQLVILDVVMPKKQGKEVYERIRSEEPDIKVIFTSGYSSDIIRKREIIEEGFDFISKPSEPKELLKKVREVLDRKN